MKKKDNRLAIVRCAEQQRILIRPNTSVSIKGYLNQETEYQPTGAVLEATQKSVLTDDLDIAPTVITYNFKDTGIIKVNVSNITTRTVSVPPNAILCELQPVVVESTQKQTLVENIEPFKDQVSIENPELTNSQISSTKTLINEYEDIFFKR